MTRRKFKCPYCFDVIADDQVHFRSERIGADEFNWPDDGNFYDSAEQFKQDYQGPNKEQYLQDYMEWEFFHPKPDARYESFWSRYGDEKTEQNLADDLFGTPAYLRRVIDPQNLSDRRFLRCRSGKSGESVEDYFFRDEDGMVTGVQLKSGEICDRRVCPSCHNPIPQDYGKYDIRYITVIGSVTSGKTVYLSQLLDQMATYAAKNGLDAHVRAEGTLAFQRNYRIRMERPLPLPTAGQHFQQPLVYEMVRRVGNTQKIDTVVLYDVSGENFHGTPERIRAFAPFVQHAHGVIVLLDPLQIRTFKALYAAKQGTDEAADREGEELDSPELMLNSIYKVLSEKTKRSGPSGGAPGEIPLCKTPVAVCLSKSDMACVRDVLSPELYTKIESEMTGVMGNDGYYRPIFDAHGYNPILDGLHEFFKRNDDTLALINTLHTNYLKYTFFAFTALGFPPELRADGLYPGPPRLAPKRIEEPLLWLFHEMGYTGVNAGIHYPGRIKCGSCGWYTTEPLPRPSEPKTFWEKFVAWFRRLFGAKRSAKNYVCKHCGNKWYEPPGR